MNANDIDKALKKIVEYYGSKVDAYLVSGNYPSGQDTYRKEYTSIEATKKIGSPATSGNEVSLKIAYGSSKQAPYAVAYEFGSGVHAYKNPGTYEINPKKVIRFHRLPGQRGKRMIYEEGKALAVGAAQFQRTGRGWNPASKRALRASPKYMGDIFDGIFAMGLVDHPGIKPRPFAEPVWLQEQNIILEMMGQGLFATIEDELRQI